MQGGIVYLLSHGKRKCSQRKYEFTLHRLPLHLTRVQWKNKRRLVRDQGFKRGRGTTKQPVLGILCRDGTVWAEVVDDVSAETLQPHISKKVSAVAPTLRKIL